MVTTFGFLWFGLIWWSDNIDDIQLNLLLIFSYPNTTPVRIFREIDHAKITLHFVWNKNHQEHKLCSGFSFQALMWFYMTLWYSPFICLLGFFFLLCLHENIHKKKIYVFTIHGLRSFVRRMEFRFSDGYFWNGQSTEWAECRTCVSFFFARCQEIIWCW